MSEPALAALGLTGLPGEGATLQEAADDLVRRVLLIAMAFRSSGIGPVNSECPSDVALLDFVFELGEIAARGDDIRTRLFMRSKHRITSATPSGPASPTCSARRRGCPCGSG